MITLDEHDAAAPAIGGSQGRFGTTKNGHGGRGGTRANGQNVPAPPPLDPSSSRRARICLLGVGVARRRLAAGVDPTLVFRRDSEQLDHQRRRRRSPGDSSSSWNTLGAASSYLSAAFLTEDVVLASDEDGFVDVVRLPRYDGGGGSDVGKKTTATAGTVIGSTSMKRGTILAGRLGDDQDCDWGIRFGPPLSRHPPPHVALRGFRGGDAFACGMRSGELRVFATERVGLGAKETDHRSNSNSSSSFVASAARLGGPRRRFRRGAGGGPRSSLARMLVASGMASSSPPPSSPLSSSPPCHLHHCDDDHHTDEIPDWDESFDGNGDDCEEGEGRPGGGDGRRGVAMPPDRSCDEVAFDLERASRKSDGAPLQDFSAMRRRNEVSWDFCEGGGGVGLGGTLLAAHVDCEADCFSLRLIDDRMCRGPVSQANGNVRIDPSDAMAVCVDKSSRDWSRCRIARHTFTATEDVTGVCFASGCRLWTSHVVQRPVTMEQLGSWDTPCHNHIKQWDLRMLSPRRALPAEEYRLVPSSSHPSFPLDDVRGCTPAHEHVVSFSRDRGRDGLAGHLRFGRASSEGGGMGSYRERATSAADLEVPHERILISSLTSSLDGETVLATLRSLYDEPYHRPVLLDSSPLGGRRDALRVLGGPPVLSVKGGHLHQSDVLQAVTPDHDLLVCHGAVQDPTAGTIDADSGDSPGDGQSVMLFDLSSRREVGSGCQGDDHDRRRDRPDHGPRCPKRCRRSSSDRGNDGGGSSSVDGCHTAAAAAAPMQGRMPVDEKIVDEIGLRSQLTCLATNRWGTAVVCGTADGDLYAWRGA